MSKCCKYAKWWPHNWLCLKGLSIFFTVLFYIAFAFAIYTAYQIFTYPLLSGAQMWTAFFSAELQLVLFAVGFLAVAKILKALCKIKHAVAPCCCEQKDKAEKAPAATEEKSN